MTLLADGVDAQSALLQIPDDADRAGALGRSRRQIEVVVVQLGAGIRLIRELERLGDVVVADAPAPRRITQRAVVVQRLVDDVPAADSSLVAADHRRNVRLHALEHGRAIGEAAAGAGPDPRRRL